MPVLRSRRCESRGGGDGRLVNLQLEAGADPVAFEFGFVRLEHVKRAAGVRFGTNIEQTRELGVVIGHGGLLEKKTLGTTDGGGEATDGEWRRAGGANASWRPGGRLLLSLRPANRTRALGGDRVAVGICTGWCCCKKVCMLGKQNCELTQFDCL